MSETAAIQASNFETGIPDVKEDIAEEKKVYLNIAIIALLLVGMIALTSEVSPYVALIILSTVGISFGVLYRYEYSWAALVFVGGIFLASSVDQYLRATSSIGWNWILVVTAAGLFLRNNASIRVAVISAATMIGIQVLNHSDLYVAAESVIVPGAVMISLGSAFTIAEKLNQHLIHWAIGSRQKSEERSTMYYKQREELHIALNQIQRANIRLESLNRELEQAREEAESANRVKSWFLASMSHELRTPLNGILNFTGFVASGMLGPVNEKQIDVLKKAVMNGEHLLALINDVLDISKIESGSLALFVENDVDIQGEIQSVIATCETMLTDKEVRLIVDIPEMIPAIRGDRRRIRQIALNLLSNACKFTEKGHIAIRARHHDKDLVISVEDTGPGIAPEDYAAVFESFRQTEAGVRSGRGTGLGLPISRRLAEAHGGNIWLESEMGKGSTFFVSLPIQSEDLKVSLLQPEIGA